MPELQVGIVEVFHGCDVTTFMLIAEDNSAAIEQVIRSHFAETGAYMTRNLANALKQGCFSFEASAPANASSAPGVVWTSTREIC